MLNRFTADARHIYLAIGATDFRKQISSLVSMVQLQFGMDPFEEACIFVFCNKKKDSVKILCNCKASLAVCRYSKRGKG